MFFYSLGHINYFFFEILFPLFVLILLTHLLFLFVLNILYITLSFYKLPIKFLQFHIVLKITQFLVHVYLFLYQLFYLFVIVRTLFPYNILWIFEKSIYYNFDCQFNNVDSQLLTMFLIFLFLLLLLLLF